MPARDIFHDSTRNALVKSGWTITHDPYTLKIGKKDLFIDLGAEKFLAAEKENTKIAVEIKSFIGASEIEDLKNAIGQYVLYQNILVDLEPERELFLAIRQAVYEDIFEKDIGELLLNRKLLKLIVFDPEHEEITQWIP